MFTFLLTIILIGVIVVTGTMANARLYNTGHHGKRFGRSRHFKSIARRPMPEVEYFARLDKVHEEGPRYARRGMLILLVLAILALIVVISLLGGLH
jgi:hypothetical protein